MLLEYGLNFTQKVSFAPRRLSQATFLRQYAFVPSSEIQMNYTRPSPSPENVSAGGGTLGRSQYFCFKYSRFKYLRNLGFKYFLYPFWPFSRIV